MTAIFGPRLIARLEPWMTPDLEILCESIGAMFDPLLEIAEEEGSDGEAGYIPAYGRLFEVKTANLNELRYLANYVGVTIPAGATEAEARALVEAESGLERGTRKAVEAAIKRVLGTSPFAIQERTSASGTEAAYHFNVIVATGKSSAALVEAIEGVKPAGVLFSVIEVVPVVWLEGTKTWEEVAAGVTWENVKEGDV